MGKRKSRSNKTFAYIFVALFLGTFALGLLWIRTRADMGTRKEMLTRIRSLEAIASRARKENLALLSLKYGVEQPRLEEILDAYLSRHDLSYRLKNELILGKGESALESTAETSLEPDSNFHFTIENLSLKYDIPPERLASLIADYKVLSRLEEDSILEAVLSGKAKDAVMKLSLQSAAAGAKRIAEE